MRHIIIISWGLAGILSGAAACSGDDGTPGDGGTGAQAGSSASSTSSGSGGSSSGTGGTTSSGGLSGGGGEGGAPIDPCEPIAGVSYGSAPTAGAVSDRPALEHPDLNLEIRGWEVVTGYTLGLIDIAGPTDPNAPRLNTLFSDDRIPIFSTNYAVYQWDWANMTTAGLITDWEVTLAGFATTPGEVLELPNAGYDIGGGNQARVLLADEDSLTLKYTLEDNVVIGYTIHIQDLCVEPSLLARYQADDAAGRTQLPALTGNQPLGRARSGEVKVAIRDCGAFMDPRSDKDWWP